MQVRRDVWPLLVSMIACSVIMAYVTFGIAGLEFNYALWSRRGSHVLPYITELLKQSYRAVWALPVMTVLVSILIWTGKISRPVWISLLVGTLAVLHTGWFFFWLLGLYLVNQSFVCGN